jgi:hypothetical protein
MLQHERKRMLQRLDAYRRLLDITTDKLARDAIQHQLERLEARLAEMDKAAAEGGLTHRD